MRKLFFSAAIACVLSMLTPMKSYADSGNGNNDIGYTVIIFPDGTKGVFPGELTDGKLEIFICSGKKPMHFWVILNFKGNLTINNNVTDTMFGIGISPL